MGEKGEFENLFSLCKLHYDSQKSEQAALYLKELFLCLVKPTKIRDQWTFTWSSFGNGLFVTAWSEKQQHEYVIGFYSSEFYINSFVFKPELLKSMKSEFWAVLSSLDLMNCFSFKESAVVNKDVKFDLKDSSSSTFNLIRNYVLLEEHNEMGSSDIGFLESIWDFDSSLDLLHEQAVESLKGIYRLNYLMYRNYYTRNHGKNSITKNN